jgi:hypothetical protein
MNEQLMEMILAKIEDEKSMLNKPNHAEYYKGRKSAFELILTCLYAESCDIETEKWDDFRPKDFI